MTLFRTPERFNSVIRIGNVLKAWISCRTGHLWAAGPAEWHHDGSGCQRMTCQLCGRVESDDTLGRGNPGLLKGDLFFRGTVYSWNIGFEDLC